MPYKSEKIRLSETQDRRRKLTEDQKEEIRQLYADGKGSWKALADKYHVSKATIGEIVNAEFAERRHQYRKEHWREYTDREKLTEAVRNLRRYKHELYLKGELREEADHAKTQQAD